MFIVKLSRGSWDDAHEVDLFVTENERLAKAYVKKFNQKLKKWKKYFRQFNDKTGFLKEEYWETMTTRYWRIRDTNHCFYKEIKVR